jgi:crossover junction endodeoxyribonuclease RuvC
MIILGIDPGLATTGFGVIKYLKRRRNPRKKKRKKEQSLRCLDYGIIETDPSLPTEKRLRKLYLEISQLIRKWQPKVIAVENLYFFKNLKTAMPISQAKGIILLAAAQKKVPVQEITPLQVKTAITGYGRADKRQIQRMTQTLLDLPELPKPDDIADALGVAICSSLIWGKNP